MKRKMKNLAAMALSALLCFTAGALTDPTYTVTVKEGTEDAGNWTIDPAAATNTGVKVGTSVTAAYGGAKRVKSVKAKKKAAAGIVNPAVGQIIGSDGNNYDADATLPSGVTKVAMICYVGSETGEAAPYNHGLALALSDADDGSGCLWKTSQTDAGHTKQSSSPFTEESGLQYNDATHNSDTYPAFKAAIANNGTAAPTGCSAWFLASGYQWQQMISAAGLSNLGLQMGKYYWSSTEYDASKAWLFGPLFGSWSQNTKDPSGGRQVRACLAF